MDFKKATILIYIHKIIILSNKLDQKTNVTGFAKRGLPHTSTFIGLKDHNFVFNYDISLKFSPSFVLC